MQHYDYDQAYEDWLDDKIEKELHIRKRRVLNHIRGMQPVRLQEFIKIFLFAYNEGLYEAHKLAQDMDLCKLDFFALSDDLEEFKKEYLTEMEKFYEPD